MGLVFNKKSATIFKQSWKKLSGQIRISPPKSIQFAKLASKLATVISFSLILITTTPLIAQEFQYQAQRLNIISWETPTPVESKLGNILNKELVPPVQKRFQLIIPKINLNVPVVANVDPSNQKEYQVALNQGIAHAKGSGLPGENGPKNQTIYLFAHSSSLIQSQYSYAFSQLNKLDESDEVKLWFWGNLYQYQVAKKEVLSQEDTRYFVSQSEKPRLVLQTCWPPGTDLKQLVVVSKPV